MNCSSKGQKRFIPDLSITVPVYNEEENVEILYSEIRDAVDRIKKNCEIIFVNDRSTDGTIEKLTKIIRDEKQEAPKNLRTKVIQFSRNYGQTSAMQAGFDYAEGDIIVSLDGDLQNNPKDIPKLLDKLEQGYDVVCGWRRDRKDKTLTRIIPSKIANWIIAKITGVDIHDNGCSLKAYNSRVIKQIKLYSDMHRFIPAMTTTVGAQIAEIEVNHRPRRYGEAKYGLSRVWKVMFDIITIKMIIHFNKRPLWWFSIPAMASLIVGFAFGAASIINSFKDGGSVIYPAVSFLALFLFGSLISWGLLAEYLIKIENQNKRTLPMERKKWERIHGK